MKINVNILIIVFFAAVLLFMFQSRKRAPAPPVIPTEPPVIICNNHGFKDENENCQCDDPWYGENCEFSQSVEGISISNVYKTILVELNRVKTTKTTDVTIFGQSGDYYISRASDAPGQKTLLQTTVQPDVRSCAEKSAELGAEFFTYHPQTKQCQSYSEPATMSLKSLKPGNLVVGCKKL